MRAFLLVALFALVLPDVAAAQGTQPLWTSRTTLIGPDGGTATPAMDTQNRVIVRPKQLDAPCTFIVQTVVSVGTTAVTVPTSRTSGSVAVEITNSAENTGSPKVKCHVDPPDGGVGFGLTYVGDVKNPGEGYSYGVDYTHTIKCASDTAATAVTTSECIP